jgi:hypothetical protein
MTTLAQRIAYKPVGVLLGVAASAVAGRMFRGVWTRVAGEDVAPNVTDEDRGWSEILAAAALQGLIFGLVKAAVDRAGATSVRKITGHWPV